MSHIFISYARSNTWQMRAVRYFLASEGFRTWADETGLRPGTDDWREALWSALHDAGCVLALCTPDARNSEWVAEEFGRAMAEKRPVFAVAR